VVIAFAPREKREMLGALTVTSSDPENAVVPVRLRGRGVAFRFP
jgi:hypothetical protein